MKIRKLTAAAAALAVAGTLAVGSTASAETSTFADVLAAQGNGTDRNWYDFDILAAGVGVVAESGVAPDLIGALSSPDAELTVFIPNDRAFQALAADLFGWRMWFASEAQVLERIAGLGAETLATVIAYHAVPAVIDSATALSVPRGTALPTVQGGEIEVYPVKRLGTAILADNDPDDIDPFLVRSKLDIPASAGFAHGIGFVLRPIDL
jgi:uncharacterized surface protein with fasciclin (FAS1) repeats